MVARFVEDEPLGTAGAIRFAAAGRVDGPFLALNGDVLGDADFGALVRAHAAAGATASIGLTPVDDAALLDEWVPRATLVLDCSDNFATRHAVNRACVALKKPLVSGAGIRFDGQVAVFDARLADSPCYECLFPEQAEPEEVRCAVMGVFAPLTGIIGCMQAAEAIKCLTGIGLSLAGRLLLFDALRTEWRSIRVPRDPQCSVCAAAA